MVLGHIKTKSMKSVTSKKTVDYAPGASYTSRRLLDTVLTTVFLAKCKYMIGMVLEFGEPLWRARRMKLLEDPSLVD